MYCIVISICFSHKKNVDDDLLSKTCRLVVDTRYLHYLRLKQDVCHTPLPGWIGNVLLQTYFVLLICFRLIPYPLVISFFGSRSSLIDYIGYFYHYLIYQILKPSSKHLYSPNILFIFEVVCCFGIPSMTVLSFHLPFQQIRGSSHTSLFLNSYVKNAISFCKLILLV